MLNTSYLVGAYIRLSREDDDKNYESESIINQKSLLLQYIKENQLLLYDFYIDDGYSGKNFNRPAFQRLLADIESKKINLVLTKDMSRLGRDYIGIGHLLEKYFPEHQIRYIAITDNVDTYLDSTNNDIAPFKAIMNDMYAKDISKKIRSSLQAKMKEGKFVGSRAPFGYQKDPKDKNHLIIQQDQALVVKKIYQLCLQGFTFYQIASYLTEKNMKTPASYYPFEWKQHYTICYHQWYPKTIKDILTNQVYIGNMVQSKRKKINYKIKKVVATNPCDYIIVENTHEAIIRKDIYQKVQDRIPKNKGRWEKKENHLLDGLLYCGDCKGRIMVLPRRKKDGRCYTICSQYRKDKSCKMHSNNYDVLEKNVLSCLRQVFFSSFNSEMVVQRVMDEVLDKLDDQQDKLLLLQEKIKRLQEKLDMIYMDKLDGLLSLEQFLKFRTNLLSELEEKKIQYDQMNTSLELSIQQKKEQIKKRLDAMLLFSSFSRKLLVILIERLEITMDKKILLKLHF